MHHSYRDSNKRTAAPVWLDEQDQSREAWQVWLEVALVTTWLAVNVGVAIWLKTSAQVFFPGI
jgi:hypothetical protein